MNTNKTVDLEEGWQQISQAINKLIEVLDSADRGMKGKAFTPTEYVNVYTLCYNMCTQKGGHNFSETLYKRHGECIENYLERTVFPALLEKRDEFLLKEMVVRWKQHEVMDKWMRKFFMYLDRYYVKHHSLPSLHESSLYKFRTLCFERVSTTYTNAILAEINKERSGEVVDRDLLKRCVSVYGKLSDKLKIYLEELETPLLNSTKEFYMKKSQDWIAQDTLPDYLVKAEDVLRKERERVDNYLEQQTKPRLQSVCEIQLLEVHEMTLLEKEGSGCRALLQDEKTEDLARLFRLFRNVKNGLQPIATIVREHITKLGEDIVSKRETALQAAKSHKEREALDPQFVQSLLDLHEKYMTLIDEQFEGHSMFQKALKEAFEVFVNHDVGKTTNAELLSAFCDRILKTGGAKLNETEIESFLERTVRLFSYLSDKDLFSEVYRHQLSKRLLMGRSASDDAETSMITKLKISCGAQFTSKMEGMVKDLRTGGDFKKAFKETVKEKGKELLGSNTSTEIKASPEGDYVSVGGIEFTVEVLTTGHWPTYKQVDLALPDELTLCMEVYKRFYDQKTSHRCLKWVHTLGNAVVKASFKRSYDLSLTTIQAVALLAFNGVSDWLSFTDVMQRLNVDEEVVKCVMHSLSCSKHKVLIKDPPTAKAINRTDKFKVNESFQSPMRKIRLPMASLDESHNPKRVEEDRSIAIEAAIVRIMKARKQMPHHQLVAEVLSQLHFFKPNPRVVKRRIEHLIDREYLERDAETPNVYKYLA